MKNLLYLLLLFTIIGCSGSDDVTDNVDDTNPVYLESNGIIVKAKDWAAIGDAGTINGVLYTIVSRETVLQAIQDRDDITRFCTSRIIDMSGMMALKTDFNQDIGSWDVSNVIDMGYMLASATAFNQDLSSWDVNDVDDYFGFSDNTPSWTLPKPNF